MITKEEIARGYDAITEKVIMTDRFYEDCLGMLSRYGGKILDVGCGQGLLLKKIGQRAAAGSQLFGLDISPKLVGMARENNPGATIEVGDAEAMPYPDGEFDIVCMTEALEHMLDYGRALAEIHRVLKPGGIFIVSVPNRDWARYDFYDKIRNHSMQPVDDHYFRFAEITGYLSGNGLKIERYRGLDNLYYYGWKHSVENVIALFLPFLNRRMKRLVFRCRNAG